MLTSTETYYIARLLHCHFILWFYMLVLHLTVAFVDVSTDLEAFAAIYNPLSKVLEGVTQVSTPFDDNAHISHLYRHCTVHIG